MVVVVVVVCPIGCFPNDCMWSISRKIDNWPGRPFDVHDFELLLECDHVYTRNLGTYDLSYIVGLFLSFFSFGDLLGNTLDELWQQALGKGGGMTSHVYDKKTRSCYHQKIRHYAGSLLKGSWFAWSTGRPADLAALADWDAIALIAWVPCAPVAAPLLKKKMGQLPKL